jgi:uncharacterized protein YjaG (DUF416 family)
LPVFCLLFLLRLTRLEREMDNMTLSQDVGSGVRMERWDFQWEIERLEKLVAKRDAEIGALRFDVAMLKAELNSIRGRKCLED